jgi:hypothetical protein
VHLRCSDSAQGRGKLTQCCALRRRVNAECGATSGNRLTGREREREGERRREKEREGERGAAREREGERGREREREGFRGSERVGEGDGIHAAHICAALTTLRTCVLR